MKNIQQQNKNKQDYKKILKKVNLLDNNKNN